VTRKRASKIAPLAPDTDALIKSVITLARHVHGADIVLHIRPPEVLVRERDHAGNVGPVWWTYIARYSGSDGVLDQAAGALTVNESLAILLGQLQAAAIAQAEQRNGW
jgi:hypothetical protein